MWLWQTAVIINKGPWSKLNQSHQDTPIKSRNRARRCCRVDLFSSTFFRNAPWRRSVLWKTSRGEFLFFSRCSLLKPLSGLHLIGQKNVIGVRLSWLKHPARLKISFLLSFFFSIPTGCQHQHTPLVCRAAPDCLWVQQTKWWRHSQLLHLHKHTQTHQWMHVANPSLAALPSSHNLLETPAKSQLYETSLSCECSRPVSQSVSGKTIPTLHCH